MPANDYDYLTAILSGVEPKKVADNEYHWPTRDARSGKILKKTTHPTLLMGLLEDMKLGYNPYIDPEGQLSTLGEGGTSRSEATGEMTYMQKALIDYMIQQRRK